MPPACRHRTKSDEAYKIEVERPGQRSVEHPVTVFLCGWPEANPDRFVNAPRWLTALTYPGLAIVPEKDCVDCPARQGPPSRV